MKRLILICLAVCLLAGCSGEQVPETTAPQPESPPITLYAPDSLAQKQTGGAVRTYPLPGTDYCAAIPMGGRLLLVEGNGRLTLLEGEKGAVQATVETGAQLLKDPAFAVSDQSVSYYREETNQLILLDSRLVEYSQVDMPEGICGNPVVNMGSGEVFYCLGQEIRALEIESGISRLVFSHRYAQAELISCQLDGKILLVKTVDADGKESLLYLESATGQIRYETRQIPLFYSYREDYLIESMDGKIRQYVFSVNGSEPACLNESRDVYSALEQKGAVACDTDDGYAILDYYDLTTGLRTGAVTIPGVSSVVDINANDRYIWLIGQQSGVYTLYRWDTVQTPLADKTVYIQPLYSAERPDLEGLSLCQEQAEKLGREYGVNVRIWMDAVAQPGSYDLEAEHRTDVIFQMLDVLEPVLAQFPEEFLEQSIDGGSLQICLVRSIQQGNSYAQYYTGGDAYIVLTPQSQMNRELIQALAYIVDSHVLGNSRDYDDWETLNPKGFEYAYTYDFQPDEQAEAYLSGEEQAFVDALAMTYPHEDRSRIFLYAMLAEGQTYFESPRMQEKLCCLCEGIREAYGMEKRKDILPWEQYLNLEMNFRNR